jgi:hypothetical protein
MSIGIQNAGAGGKIDVAAIEHEKLEFGPDSQYLNGVPPSSGHSLSSRGAELKNSESEYTDGGAP